MLNQERYEFEEEMCSLCAFFSKLELWNRQWVFVSFGSDMINENASFWNHYIPFLDFQKFLVFINQRVVFTLFFFLYYDWWESFVHYKGIVKWFLKSSTTFNMVDLISHHIALFDYLSFLQGCLIILLFILYYSSFYYIILQK